MKRYKLDSFVRVRSKGKMIKTAPSDTLRPLLGAQQSSHTLGARSSRQVDLWTTRFSNSIRQRGTSWRSSRRLGRRTGYACLERGAVRRSTKGGDPKCQGEFAQRFLYLGAGRKIIRHAARSRRQRGIQGQIVLDPQTSAACPRASTDVKFSLKIRILHSGVFRWTYPNGGQKGGQIHSQTKRGLIMIKRSCLLQS